MKRFPVQIAASARRRPFGVIDIGSNSARLVVYRSDGAGQLVILASARSALRLVRDVDAKGTFTPQSVENTLQALADFRAVALGAGAARVVAVATAAMRDAANGPELMTRIRREFGIRIILIGGEEEAYYGALGGIRALPVTGGVVFDVGGGSAQLSTFRNRVLAKGVSFPLGSLRLSRAFLKKSSPKPKELKALRKHVRKTLSAGKARTLKKGERLVGVGGTVRNLARMDARARGYPIARVHGYMLTHSRLASLIDLLSGKKAGKSVPGLNSDRKDSILGGAVAIDTLMEYFGATEVIVSGQGLREGLAHSLLKRAVIPAQQVRAASVSSLCKRFSTWDRQAAKQRTTIAATLYDALMPDGGKELREAVIHSATVLDIGMAVDFFDRYEHAADMVIDTDLEGFTHREVALIAALLHTADDNNFRPRSYSPLLGKNDRTAISRGAMVLVLADEFQQRSPPRARVRLRCTAGKKTVTISVQGLEGWTPRKTAKRFQKAFKRKLVIHATRYAKGDGR